jgi:hypothetical protein
MMRSKERLSGTPVGGGGSLELRTDPVVSDIIDGVLGNVGRT